MNILPIARTQVFVSYNHKDTKWLERLHVHLKPLVREGNIVHWDDTQLQPGVKWQDAIRLALDKTKVAVLLISADFMASEFIFNKELPPLLAAAQSDGAIILPVIISPCSFERTALAQFQSVNPPSKPMLGMSKVNQELIWQRVVVTIDQVLAPNLADTHTIHLSKQTTASSALRVFLSYSHKDEEFKDELVTMLAGLQRRGLVDTWSDRRIEAGDEWNKSIQDAMDDCDLALLLVSPDYLASRFIQENEQPKLLKRREEIQARVIPIIVRPCKWTSEPVFSNVQALPRDGKPIITFSKDNGDRDQVWADIATVIEKRAKK